MIVDEEQRFGVKQKELLRQLKLKVDVLSLSATPIPRTLQMSLAGLRDISVIETPPEGRRPIRTYVGPFDEELVRRAIEREAARGGQAFFLHNRIDTLHETAERLRAICPGVRFAEAHGQMDERELEETMLTFLRGDADCLVATTIIESGLDIPQANTLIVERADQLGLAQAYQIRGRVGRSRQRAFAYLLYPSEEGLSREAGARLATLSDHTELGSGFAIAMRDLELRGAGDLLGDEQSGHVAAVGFELYVLASRRGDRGAAGRRGGGRVPRRRCASTSTSTPTCRPSTSLRGREDRRSPQDRRGARAGRAAGAGGGAARPLRPAPEPGEPVLAPAGANRVRRARAPGPSRYAEAACRRPRSSSTPPGRRRARADPEAIHDWRAKTLSLRVPDEPEERLAAVLALAEALAARPEPPRPEPSAHKRG